MDARGRLIVTIAAGVVLGALATVSPLTLAAGAMAAMTIAAARSGLSADDRRTVTAILAAGILARVVVVMALAVWSIPLASDESGGVLFGDENYLFDRALRTRDLLLGFPVVRLDYITVFDPYADTKYLSWLSWVQVMFGPSPYAMRLVNGLMFVAASAVMYRLARRGFGARAAACGLAVLLFLPSLMFWSVSLLKDSLFFLLTAIALAATVATIEGSTARARLAAAILLVLALWGLSDLRPLAIPLTAGGIALGLIIRWGLKSRRALVALAAAIIAATVVVASTPLSSTLLELMTILSRQHIGHATTPGHAYRTLDSRFYHGDASRPMDAGEAARYVVRSTAAFLTAPLPWRATTRGELAYVPEQLAWYAVAVCAVLGLGTAIRRDALLTGLLLGYMLIFSAALALTNGNVGTLVRLRTLVSRFAIWLAVVGVMAAIDRAARSRMRHEPAHR